MTRSTIPSGPVLPVVTLAALVTVGLATGTLERHSLPPDVGASAIAPISAESATVNYLNESIEFCDMLTSNYEPQGNDENAVMVVRDAGHLQYTTLEGVSAVSAEGDKFEAAAPVNTWWRHVRGRWPVQTTSSLVVVAAGSTFDNAKLKAMDKATPPEKFRALRASANDFVIVFTGDPTTGKVNRVVLLLGDSQASATFWVYNRRDNKSVTVVCDKENSKQFVQTNMDGTLDTTVHPLVVTSPLYRLLYDKPNGVMPKATAKYLDTAPYGS